MSASASAAGQAESHPLGRSSMGAPPAPPPAITKTHPPSPRETLPSAGVHQGLDRQNGPSGSGSQSNEHSVSDSSQQDPPVIKKENRYPDMPAPMRQRPSRRGRPQGLDLSREKNGAAGTKDPALSNLAFACLSPGFRTSDPALRETMSRSLEVIETQRRIIEARQNGQPDPPTPRRKGPPPRLSLRGSSGNFLALNERAIRSAPLNSSFTGLNRPPPHLQQHQQKQHPQQQHHQQQPQPSIEGGAGPAERNGQQQSGRLPPISNLISSSMAAAASSNNSHPQQHQPSPSCPSSPSGGQSRSIAAQHVAAPALSNSQSHPLGPPVRAHSPGADRQPSHYRPPPSPPFSAAPSQPQYAYTGGPEMNRYPSGRRRQREEYEREMGSPPLGRHVEARRPNPFSGLPDEQDRKKQEFLDLCSRAWDLFHS